jgi:predicted dehydrogenase
VHFGVIGTADIATEDVIPAIGRSDHEVTAIASRDGDRARAVADALEIDRSYGSYDALLADGDVEAVYNPLPNGLHAEWTRRAADEGLHVLCEKPLAVSATEAAETFDYCETRGVTLMEAFMYRFHPRTERAREVARDVLGELRSGEASFTFNLRGPEAGADIRMSPDLGGGSLLDVGCYAVDALRGILGEPTRAYAEVSDSRGAGVDTSVSGVLAFPGGVHARIGCGFDTPRRQVYRVEAADGWLAVRNAFNAGVDEPMAIEYERDGERVTETERGDHYRRQVEAFADAAAAGRTPPRDRSETVATARVLDALAASGERGRPVAVGDRGTDGAT